MFSTFIGVMIFFAFIAAVYWWGLRAEKKAEERQRMQDEIDQIAWEYSHEDKWMSDDERWDDKHGAQ